MYLSLSLSLAFALRLFLAVAVPLRSNQPRIHMKGKEAGDAFVKQADVLNKMNERDEACTAYLNASKAYKKASPHGKGCYSPNKPTPRSSYSPYVPTPWPLIPLNRRSPMFTAGSGDPSGSRALLRSRSEPEATRRNVRKRNCGFCSSHARLRARGRMVPRRGL